MSVASGGSVDKAWFFNEETGVWFEVQYNPLSFNLERSAKWDEKPVPGNAPTLEYGGTALATASMELMFDTTHDGSDVRSSWVVSSAPVEPGVQAGGRAGSDAEKRRPARVWFSWGSQNMLCVVESVSTSFMMFSSAGVPLRAKVALSSRIRRRPPTRLRPMRVAPSSTRAGKTALAGVSTRPRRSRWSPWARRDRFIHRPAHGNDDPGHL